MNKEKRNLIIFTIVALVLGIVIGALVSPVIRGQAKNVLVASSDKDIIAKYAETKSGDLVVTSISLPDGLELVLSTYDIENDEFVPLVEEEVIRALGCCCGTLCRRTSVACCPKGPRGPVVYAPANK